MRNKQNNELAVCGFATVKKLAARKGIYNKVNDPASIELCYKLGLNYVSCSPFRVPAARLAGAQAVIKANKK